MTAANDRIADALVRHSIGLDRLSNASVRRIIKSLQRADARIVARLATGYEPQSSQKRQKALLREIRAILDAVYTDAVGDLRIDLDDLSVYEAEFLKGTVNRVVPSLGFSVPSTEQLHAAVYSRPFQGRLLKDWFTDLPDAAFRRLKLAIVQGYVEGRTNAEIQREIVGTRANGYRDGIQQINRRDAEVTVRTAVSHVANAAREMVYKTNGDLLRAVQWVAVLDTRTSLICAGRDGNLYRVGVGPRPPAHPRCRSTTTPVLKSARQLPKERFSEIDRAKMTGQNPEDLTFGAWLRRQNVAEQNDVLGERKAILFRRGELQIDRFTAKNGREYTLDELKRRESEAWTKAGLD